MAIVTALLPLIVLPAAVQRLPTQTVWIDTFANAGIFVLLALGLNVVVGLAGLLDLGYAAFFAIGAYTYAYGRLAVHRPAPPVLADAHRRRRRRRGVRHRCSAHRRCACAATTWPS